MGVMDAMPGATAEQKRAALEAMAKAGTAGVEAYQQGLSHVDSAQQRAVQSATAGGAWMGGQAQNELAGIASRSGDAARQALQSQLANYQANNAARQASTSGYFDQVAASVPAIKAWGDSQAQLAGKQAEIEYNRQLQAQRMALEEHQQRMAQMQASAARQAAAQKAQDDYTTAQKTKIAQAMASLQQRSEQTNALQGQVDANNSKITTAWNATRDTPNEQAPQTRSTLSADRAEHDATTIHDARVTMMPSVSWEDTVPQPTNNNLWSAFSMPGQIAAQAKQMQEREAQRNALEQMLAQIEQQAAVPKKQLDLLNADTQHWQDQYNTAYDQFGDQGLALLTAGSMTDPTKLYNDYVNQSSGADQFLNYLNSGYKTPQEAYAAQQAQNKLALQGISSADQDLASKIGEDPQAVAQVRQTQTYNDLLQKAAEYKTSDQVREFLISQAAADPSVQDLIPLVIADLSQRGLLFSQGYVNANG